MPHDCDYLIVGGGMTADAAAKGIRERDRKGRIAILAGESVAPYARPPLSKDVWKDGSLADLALGTRKAAHAELHLSRTVESIDRKAHTAEDSAGETWRYRKLLLATGAKPKALPFSGSRVICYRTLDDLHRTRKLAKKGAKVAVIGAGFIGSEMAAALTLAGCQVTMLFPGAGLCAHFFPPRLCDFVSGYYAGKGVELLAGVTFRKGKQSGAKVALELSNGETRRFDLVVAGIGVEPNVDLAHEAGLKVGDGIFVDEMLRTRDENVFAAGDVAAFEDRALGIRRRVEHEDAATSMGRVAGLNMAGARTPYTHLPYFYSDLFDLGYEAVGQFDARMDLVEDWKVPFREGVIYYLEKKRVRGVLLWNVWEQKDAARNLIRRGARHSRKSLVGRIPR